MPEKIKSGALLSVPIKVTGLGAGEEARVTVAATDVGILNLTRFETPKPDGWFFGQRRMGIEVRDLYGRLIDGMRAERGKLQIRRRRRWRHGHAGQPAGGGDAGAVLRHRQSRSPTARQGSSSSSPISTAPCGSPPWPGLADKVGSASKDLIVRDPVAMTVSAPRFITLGDQTRLELALHNVEGQPGAYTVTGQFEAEAGAKAQAGFERSVAIAAGERKRESFELKPSEVGLTKLTVRIAGPGGVEVKRTLTFDVKVPAGDIRRMTVATLAAKGGKISLSPDLVQDLIPRRTKVTLTVGPQGALDVPGLLASLDRYPYGCAEQTTSRALPLLYVNDVAKRIGLASDAQVRERIEGAIARVLEMQDASGAFGVWGPSDGDMWLTSYVTDFLTRAKESKYEVRKQSFDLALDRLANYISYVQDFERGGEARAYALYVLARNGRAPIGELRYYVDTKLDDFATPLAQAQLGAALAMMGDRPRAERALRSAFRGLTGKDDEVTRRDYGTSMRDGAALITLAAETGVAKTEVPRMIELVAKAYASRVYTSTQEQAWMVLAARALADEAKAMSLTVNGAPHKGQLVKGLTADELKAGTLTVVNTGDAPAGAVVSVLGAALTPEPAIAKGFTIERSYYSLDGKKIELGSATGGQGQLNQNDRLVVVLKIESPEEGGRILLVDRLPAGLEIENPRLVDSGDIKTLSWLKTTPPQHTEFRDDRFVAAFDFFGGSDGRRRGWRGSGDADNAGPASSATVAYIVRAVTPGSFVHPAATVEDMYRADRFARTPAGRLEVVAKN